MFSFFKKSVQKLWCFQRVQEIAAKPTDHVMYDSTVGYYLRPIFIQVLAFLVNQ